MSKRVRGALAVAALSIFALFWAFGQTSGPPRGRGEEWLSWSPEQRLVFVGAYLQGYLMGKLDGCNAAGELFEQHKAVRDPDDLPERRCFRHAKGYSRNADEYATLIAAFYAKHVEHRDMPVDYFMLLFTDDRYKTVTDIEEGIRKGEVRTRF
jgi:hypothetical protein